MSSAAPEIPATMRAIVMHERGEAEVLRLDEKFPTPVPAPDEILVRVRAATVNHTDIFHRTGQFFIQKELPHILGMDVAGDVAAVGAEVSGLAVGERVVATFEALGRERNGAYAEFTTIPAFRACRMPEKMAFATAASIGLAFTTAWSALVVNGRLGAHPNFADGETVVIHAASSGVGVSAIQIAAWRGANVLAISTADKADKLRELGAHAVIPRDTPDLAARVRETLAAEFGNNAGASLVLDLVGRDTLRASVAMLAPHGRVVVAGTLSGDVAEIDAMDVLMKNAAIVGSFRPIAPAEFDRILGLFDAGKFVPVIDSVLPLHAARAAHEKIEAKQAVGKIILDPTL